MGVSFWRWSVGAGLVLLLAACGQPETAATDTQPASSQAPVTLGGGDEPAASGSEQPAVSVGAPVTSHGGAVSDHVSLVDHLRGQKLMVEPIGVVEQPFSQTKGETLRVSGGALAGPIELQSFEYADASLVEQDASQIQPDGNLKTTMIEWRAPPHFFRKERLMVLYLGDDPAALQLLTDTLGPQFAGR